MKLLDFLKTAKDRLIGNGEYEDGSSDVWQSDATNDEEYVDNLSEYDNDDEDLDGITDQIEEVDISPKEQMPAEVLAGAYRIEEQSKSEREQQRAKYRDAIQDKKKQLKLKREQQRVEDRSTIIGMLDNYENLAEEEKERLTKWDDRFCVSHLKKSDVGKVKKIVGRWLQDRSLDDGKIDILRDLINEDLGDVISGKYFSFSDTPLTETDYEQAKVLYSLYWGYYREFMDYAQRYWLNSGNKPEPIACDDLIANRPCYLKMGATLWSPHFHMGKRYFEENCRQMVALYLFSDALEYISDGGHVRIDLSDVIDLSINNWNSAEEPDFLEITCRYQGKTLIGTGDTTQLLVLRALMLYFIKNPQ